jgi:hypothetical protein
MNENLENHELAISSQDFSYQRRETRLGTPRASSRASLLRGRAFSRMNNEEQREFLAQRFLLIDVQELAAIVKAVYGSPADKGRPRMK